MLNTVIHGDATDQPPLLIAHGLFGSARNWGVIAKRLSNTRQVVAVDMRNHGDSPWTETHSYPDLADDLAQVIRTHGGQMDVLGHSMGGKAAMVLALQHADLVKRLIVADIAPVRYSHTQMGPLDAMRSVDLSTVTARRDAQAQMNLDIPTATFLLQSLDLQNKRWTLNLDTLASEMHKIVGFPDVTGTYTGPALFLRGATSAYVAPDSEPLIYRLFPAATIDTVADAGHWLHAEQPRATESAIRKFLGAS